MTSIVFYFQVHQPWRVSAEAAGAETLDGLFDQGLNRMVVDRVAERCYLPTNAVLLEAIRATSGRFRCAFSISGTALAQFERWQPAVIESFRELVETGSVELICETSHHSHAALAAPEEFADQVALQQATLERLFGTRPTAFRNTELVLDESILRQVERLGFATVLGEGADGLLGGRSPHLVWKPTAAPSLALLLRDYSLSDDIGYRFSNREWPGYPLFADTYARWLADLPRDSPCVNLFMDYETFGEHQWAETGILEFLRALPEECLRHPHLDFATPSAIAADHAPAGTIGYPRSYSWADAERDISAWFGNPMQRDAHAAQYKLAERARGLASERPDLLEAWRCLTTSDHTYYMSTRFIHESDGEVHDYFSHHESPYAAYSDFLGALRRLEEFLDSPPRAAAVAATEAPRR
ncbi:MAG: glycoside hydrolase family 57 protein [Planctomycetota bacterium]